MGKKKRTNNKQNSSSTTMKNFDEKVLAREIIQAYEEFEQKKKFEIEKREQENQKEWNQILGQKEYPENENWFWKNVHKKRNDIVALYKLLFFKQKDVRDPRATFVLISLATMGIFSICKWMLYIFVISIIVGMFKMKIDILLGITLSFVLWMLARIFRMASFEVEKIRDGNLLIAIFSGVLSFVAVVIAKIGRASCRERV